MIAPDDAWKIVDSAMQARDPIESVAWIYDRDLPKGPVAIVLQFLSCCLVVSVNPDDDTIVVADSVVAMDSDLVTRRLDLSDPRWAPLRGATLRWVWMLTNNLDCLDGMQFEFRQADEVASFTLQVVAVASTLDVRLVERLGPMSALLP